MAGKTSAWCAAGLILVGLTTAQAAPVCDRFTSRVVVVTIDGRECAFAYARCRDGEMGPDGRFTGRLLSREVGRGKVACQARHARNAIACNNDESETARFCWSRRDEVFRPGGLE
jgi:hypothetical protein